MKYYMSEPSELGDFGAIEHNPDVRICIYNVPIYIRKLEREAYGHIETDAPLPVETIRFHALMQEPRNMLPYQMITTRKELEGKRDWSADCLMRRYSAGDSVKGPWKK